MKEHQIWLHYPDYNTNGYDYEARHLIKALIAKTTRHYSLHYFAIPHYIMLHYTLNGHLILSLIRNYDDHLLNIMLDEEALSFRDIQSEFGSGI